MNTTKYNWNSILKLGTIEEQVEEINRICDIHKDMTLTDISTQLFGLASSTISKYFREKGYKFIQGKYIKDDAPTGSTEPRKATEEENLKYQLMFHANKILSSLDDTKVKSTSIKMYESIDNELDDFMSNNKIFKKQDIINVALKIFLNRYNK
jgi:hypothetical protein